MQDPDDVMPYLSELLKEQSKLLEVERKLKDFLITFLKLCKRSRGYNKFNVYSIGPYTLHVF